MTRHLLHIGYPKAGSTFLRQWFRAHPQLAYDDGALAGFRNVYEIARQGAVGGVEPRYRVTSSESLSIPTEDTGRMRIDYEGRRITSRIEAQDSVCRTLGELFPKAVILIVTRGFRSLILSSYSQFVRSGGCIDFEDVVTAARGPDFERMAPWDFNRLIGIYRERFGAGNVIVLPFELLRDDPAAFTRTLAQRLDIDALAGDSEPANESLSPSELYWYPRLARLVFALRSRRLDDLYVRASFTNRLRILIAILRKIRPRKGVTIDMVPEDLVERFRGYAESLREDPIYAPYANDYLFKRSSE